MYTVKNISKVDSKPLDAVVVIDYKITEWFCHLFDHLLHCFFVVSKITEEGISLLGTDVEP